MGGSQKALTLCSEVPKEVPLPDDDAAHVRLLCKIAHFSNHKIPDDLGCKELKEFAVFVDKYNCASAVHLTSQHWFQHEIQFLAGNRDCERMIEASRLINELKYFKEATAKYAFHAQLRQ